MLAKIGDVESIGSLWFAARSFGVKLHGNDHAYRRVFGAVSQPCRLLRSHDNFWSGQFLWATAMNLSQVSYRHSWGSTSRSLLAFVCALGMSATIPRAAVTCDYHVTVSPRIHEQLRDKRTLCYAFTPWSTVSHMAGEPSCTFVMLAQSAFPLCRPIRGILYCWLQPQCDPPTNLPFGRALTLRFVASWPKPVDDSQKARSQHRYSKMEILFATLAVSITAHSVKLMQPQLTFGGLMKPLISNALCWAQGTSEPVVIHDYQHVQCYESLVVDTPGNEMNVLYDTGSSNLWVPSSDCYDGTQVTFSTTIAINTYVANDSTFRIEYGSGPVSGFYSEDTGCQSQVTLSPR